MTYTRVEDDGRPALSGRIQIPAEGKPIHRFELYMLVVSHVCSKKRYGGRIPISAMVQGQIGFQ